MKGSSYIPLPDNILKKKAIINMKNTNDQKCFMWSMLRHIYKCKHPNPERLTDLKQYEDELNFKNIKFPVKQKTKS